MEGEYARHIMAMMGGQRRGGGGARRWLSLASLAGGGGGVVAEAYPLATCGAPGQGDLSQTVQGQSQTDRHTFGPDKKAYT